MTDESYKNKGIINGFNKCLTIDYQREETFCYVLFPNFSTNNKKSIITKRKDVSI